MLLEINDLVKVFSNSIRANDGISLKMGQGEVFGLLGPNGAGKTTLVNQVIGLTKPTSGSININGILFDSDKVIKLIKKLKLKKIPLDSRPTFILTALVKVIPENVEGLFCRVWAHRDLNVQSEIRREQR